MHRFRGRRSSTLFRSSGGGSVGFHGLAASVGDFGWLLKPTGHDSSAAHDPALEKKTNPLHAKTLDAVTHFLDILR
jgi:hypothetical protein